jgi:hypothetical protein
LKLLMFFAQCANQCARKLAPLNPQPEREDTLPKPLDSHKGAVEGLSSIEFARIASNALRNGL